MERKILNQKEHIEFLYDELEKKEQEIDKFKKELDDANDYCRKKAKLTKSDQDTIEELKKVVEEQKSKIFCLRKHRDKILERHENAIDNYETEFKEKENDIKILQENVIQLKKERTDQDEEINAKVIEIHELQDNMTKKDLKSSKTSLSEELKVVNIELEKGKLEQENKDLRFKVKTLEKTIKERAIQYSRMDKVSDKIHKQLKDVNQSWLIPKPAHEKPKCKLKWNCN